MKGVFIDVGNGAKSWLIGASFRLSPANGTSSLSHGTKKPVRNEIFCRLRDIA